jgi:hypothetical protein
MLVNNYVLLFKDVALRPISYGSWSIPGRDLWTMLQFWLSQVAAAVKDDNFSCNEDCSSFLQKPVTLSTRSFLYIQQAISC